MKTLLASMAAASLLVGCSTCPQHTRAWEYQTVTGHLVGSDNRLDAAINRETSQGWQFVTAGQYAEQIGFAVMKKAKK
ncbi:MAG TPA: hypothetical protein VNZ22_08750 [Bacillota bacterium]|nr:hypothetical protein [Bacillota bacterium]